MDCCVDLELRAVALRSAKCLGWMFIAGGLVWSSCTRAAELNVSALELVFDETFRDLSVSPNGPNTRWKAHTPWHGDFGDATFVNPQPGFPFNKVGGEFQIEMRKNLVGHWESGLLSTVGPDGEGFKLRYGYFEMRAKLPAGPGVWPAFWLNAQPAKGTGDPAIEVDIFEHYGKFPAAYNTTVTVWPTAGAGQKPRSTAQIIPVASGSLSSGFHDFGAKIDPAWTVFYFDRIEVWRTATPPEHHTGFMILADLGLGGGWPIDGAPNPSAMWIEYVRAYVDPSDPKGGL